MLANRQPSFCGFSTLTETMRMSITIQFPCRETIPHDIVYIAKNAGFLEHEYLCLKHDPIGPLGAPPYYKTSNLSEHAANNSIEEESGFYLWFLGHFDEDKKWHCATKVQLKV